MSETCPYTATQKQARTKTKATSQALASNEADGAPEE